MSEFDSPWELTQLGVPGQGASLPSFTPKLLGRLPEKLNIVSSTLHD